MAYYNPNDSNFYPTQPTFEWFDAYSSQSQVPGVGEFDNHAQAHEQPANNWGMFTTPGPKVGEWIDLRAQTGNGDSVAPATSHATEVDSWRQPSYTLSHWSGIEQAQPENTGYPNRNTPFVSTTTQETPTTTPSSGNVAFDYSRENQSGLSTATFECPVQNPDVQTINQHRSGPTRTKLVSTGRFQPYGMPRARANEHINAEAGPSTLVQPSEPYVAPPTSQPPGWTPETTADAENKHPIAEGEEAPVQGKTRVKKIRPWNGMDRLRTWVRDWNNCPEYPGIRRELAGNPEFPDVVKALAVAVEVIPTLRSPVYPLPCLGIKKGGWDPNSHSSTSERNQRERGNRSQGRMYLRELSRYYVLEPGKAKWWKNPLLKKVLEDLESLEVPEEIQRWSALGAQA